METRENPNDSTQAQWKNSNGEWVNFKKGSSKLLIGSIGTSHDIREMLPQYKSLTADNFMVVINSVTAKEIGNSMITTITYNVAPSYNPNTGIVSASISKNPSTGAVSASLSGNIYYVG